MGLQERLNEAMKEAMKARQNLRLNAIRGVRTAIKNKEIEVGHGLDDQEVVAVISTLVKQRKESAEIYRANARPELADKEEQELAVLQEFLPAQLDEAALRAMVAEVAGAMGASGIKDMGRVMKALMDKTTGRADGKLVSELVKRHLSG
jgi:uncharacterized protein